VLSHFLIATVVDHFFIVTMLDHFILIQRHSSLLQCSVILIKRGREAARSGEAHVQDAARLRARGTEPRGGRCVGP
jgi:hypothetical protein